MTTSQIITIVFIAVALIAAAVLVVYLIKTQNYKVLSKIALRLVAEAEEKFAIEGEKTGTTKYGYVSKALLQYIPDLIKPFIPASALEEIIEAAVELLKEQLEKAADDNIVQLTDHTKSD